jgi:CRP-like cAMP-binding protein/DNA-binding NarL/FixJ family response regulator
MSKMRIQIVEDEAITALDIEEMVADLGYEPINAVDTASAAFKVAQEQRPNMVLMDVSLKGEEDGISAALKIWQNLKIPIVFITAYSDEATLSRAKEAQPFGYILKPFSKDDLKIAINLAFYRHQIAVGSNFSNQEKNDDNFISDEFEDTKNITLNEAGQAALAFLRRVDPFRELDDSTLHEMAKASFFKTYESGHQLIREGDEEAPCFIVASGRVSCVKASASGKELVVTLLGPGDPYALFVALDQEAYPYTVRVERESAVLCTPTAFVLDVFQKNKSLYQSSSEAVLERLREADELARQLAHEKVEVRIAGALFSLMGRFGKLDRSNQRYQIQVTRQELADLVGTTPETAIRVTRAMENKGILDLAKPGRIVVIDSALLEERING